MTSTVRGGRRRGLRATAAAAVLLPAMVLAGGCAANSDPKGGVPLLAPSPSATAQVSSLPAAPVTSAEPAAPPLPESTPVSLTIPSIGAQSKVIRLGLDAQGALEVPPGEPGSPAGWYEHSPTPGELGPAVLLGHVNAEGGGPGIFADLRRLAAGDRIEVAREDGSTAVFTVQAAEQYAKDNFPTLKVYGNTAGPELRLITCDGYDPETGKFDDNYVVYAVLAPVDVQ
ncbi:class F sortase [Arthrobacter sp. zg-Y750]|uniref:class F sortase n=1 Tax=Arthrobacter sp. zg-Y750 TaxID=2894189 RepID=UPI001E4298E3|nr:class F sortase [Arthrobacter sp. zg-Y750]MCC9177240.1 class F sortase [Arthrobacter sp. zg-Y750]